MQELKEKNIQIKKKIMTMEEAEEFYQKEHTFRGKLQVNSDKDKVSLYYCEEYYNYFYGTMPATTGFADLFKIEKFRDGFLVIYPSKNHPNEIQQEKQSLKEELKAKIDEITLKIEETQNLGFEMSQKQEKIN